MAKSIAKSCPLCLSVNDPVDMLPVTMAHSTPPQTAPLYLCRLCVIQIMKATLVTDVVDPSEVFGAVAGADVSGQSEARDSEIAPSSSPETPAASTEYEQAEFCRNGCGEAPHSGPCSPLL